MALRCFYLFFLMMSFLIISAGITPALRASISGSIPSGIDSEQYLEKTEQYYKRDGIFSAKAAAGTRLGDGIKTLGKIRKERLVSDSELDRLIDFTRRKIYDTGVSVMSGNVTVSPIDDNSVSACAYCDYGDICKVSRNPECRRKLEPLPDGFLEKEDLRS